MDDKIAKALRAQFDSAKVGKLPKVTCGDCSNKDRKCENHKRNTCRTCKAYVSTQHIHIDYVGHADVTDRLLSVDPEWNWEPLGFRNDGLPAMDDNGGMWIKLTVGGTTRLGYGNANGKRGGDAVKEIIGDAIRNAAMRFGVALDLWRKEKPEPVSDIPDAPVERPAQTPVDRATELRGQIAVVAKAKGRSIAEVADEFASWSRGEDIRSASPVVLVGYLDHLRTQAVG